MTASPHCLRQDASSCLMHTQHCPHTCSNKVMGAKRVVLQDQEMTKTLWAAHSSRACSSQSAAQQSWHEKVSAYGIEMTFTACCRWSRMLLRRRGCSWSTRPWPITTLPLSLRQSPRTACSLERKVAHAPSSSMQTEPGQTSHLIAAATLCHLSTVPACTLGKRNCACAKR